MKKGIAVAFLPGKVLMVDMDDSNKIIGIAIQGDDGVFYISDEGTVEAPGDLNVQYQALMAILREHGSGSDNASTEPAIETPSTDKAAQL